MAKVAKPSQELTQNKQQLDHNRELRRGYRDLQQTIQRSKDDLGDFSKDSLQQALGNANLLHEKVNRPREQAKDSEVFCSLAASGVEQAKKLAAGAKSRTAKDVIRRLKYRFASEGQADVEEDPTCYDWLAAGDHCFHLFGCAVGVGCMLGAMAAQPKVRNVAQRQQRTKLGVLEKPKEVKNINTEDKQETDRIMEEMYTVLEQHQTVGWLELVMNHKDFSQTVENIFTLSFLVRDSKVSFTPDAALGMLVHLHKGKKGGSDDSKERVQSMQSYGMEDWKDWKGFIAPADCLMKHRTSDMYASQASAGPSGAQSQQAPEAGAKTEGSKAAKGKRVAPAALEDESQESENEDSAEEDCRPAKSGKRSKCQR